MDPPQQHLPDSMPYYPRPGQLPPTLREPGFWLPSQGFEGDETLHGALWGEHGEAQSFASPMQQPHRQAQTPLRMAAAPASSITFPEPQLPLAAPAHHMMVSHPPPYMLPTAPGARMSYPQQPMSFDAHPLQMPFPQPNMSFASTHPSSTLVHPLRSETWHGATFAPPYPSNGVTTAAPPDPMYFEAARNYNSLGYPYPYPAVPTGPSKQESYMYGSPESARKPSDSMPAHPSNELQEDQEPIIEEIDEEESADPHIDRPGPATHQAPSRIQVVVRRSTTSN